MLPIGFAIALLDQEYVAQDLLPALTRRHFGEKAQNDYVLGVSGGEPMMFQSAAQTPTAANADVSIGFFRLQIAEVRERLRQRLPVRPVPPDFIAPTGTRARPAGPPPVQMMMPMMGILAASEQAEGLWQLRVRHQSGSLAAAVAHARRRNLLLSFSILLLLSASVFLLVRSARRARQLAEQQLDFVAGVSHEFRTPLTVIESAAYNLSTGVTRSPEQMQQYGQIIRKQTRQLHEMIEQILEFAGMQSGRPPRELQPLQLNP